MATTSFERGGSGPGGVSPIGRIALYLVLLLIGAFFLLPLVWMFSTAFKPFVETLQPTWIPQEPTLENFVNIFNDPSIPVLRWFVNSLGVASAFTALVVLLDSLAAYAYARLEFPGRKLLFGLLLATLVMPGIMFLVPNYVTIARLGWLNTYQGVIAPGLSGVFGVFFMRQFFQSIPKELEEAAYIDGATVWTTFFRVALPLASGAIATLAIITFLTSWNDFLWPLLILNDRELQTLPVGLATIQGQYTFDYGKLMAGAVVTAVPVLILYVFLQRYIIKNVAMTGLKG
ncbi:MAG: carbohydrate ABC transporter permease [Roseiflexaceae bacterium]